jgi:hypothetical protein
VVRLSPSLKAAQQKNLFVAGYKKTNSIDTKITVTKFADAMETSDRLQQVSTLYGPGTFGGWLFTLASVLVAWTADARAKNRDTITNDLLATLTLPVIASLYLLFRVHQFPGTIEDLITNRAEGTLQCSAAIEAPLNVCETYLALAITLVGIAKWYGHRKRALCAFIVSVLCFSTEIILLVGARTLRFLQSPLHGHSCSTLWE